MKVLQPVGKFRRFQFVSLAELEGTAQREQTTRFHPGWAGAGRARARPEHRTNKEPDAQRKSVKVLYKTLLRFRGLFLLSPVIFFFVSLCVFVHIRFGYDTFLNRGNKREQCGCGVDLELIYMRDIGGEKRKPRICILLGVM